MLDDRQGLDMAIQTEELARRFESTSHYSIKRPECIDMSTKIMYDIKRGDHDVNMHLKKARKADSGQAGHRLSRPSCRRRSMASKASQSRRRPRATSTTAPNRRTSRRRRPDERGFHGLRATPCTNDFFER